MHQSRHSPVSTVALWTLPAFLMVGTQLLLLPLLQYFFGATQNVEIMLLIGAYTAIVLGEANLLPGTVYRYALLIAGVVFIALGWCFDSLVLLGIEHAWVRLLFTFLLAGLLVLTGQALARGVYHRDDLPRNYQFINVISSVLVVMWLSLLPYLGLSRSMFLIGSVLLLTFVANRRGTGAVEPARINCPITLNRQGVMTIIAGIVSAGSLSIFFSTAYLLLHPGHTFAVYLVTAFLMLGLAPLLLRGLRRCSARFSLAHVVMIGASVLVCLYFAAFGGIGDTLWIDPVRLYQRTPTFGFGYTAFAILLTVALMTPYIFFACIIPQADHESRNNHLFLCSLGNIAGFIAFDFILSLFSMGNGVKLKIVVILATVFWLVSLEMRKQSAWKAILIPLIVGLWFIPDSLDDRIITQSMRMSNLPYRHGSKEGLSASTGNYVPSDIRYRIRTGKEVGYLYRRDIAEPTRFGLGGYWAYFDSDIDRERDLVMEDVFTPSTRSVLILGLGNHLALAKASALLEKHGVDSPRIDVVDSFAPFKKTAFREYLARRQGFTWNTPGVRFHYGDAFQFLARSEPETYDIIIWNLVYPSYDSKLFTMEFSSCMARALRQSGLFLTYNFGNKRLDDTLRYAFADGWGVSRQDPPSPYGIGVFTRDNHEVSFPREARVIRLPKSELTEPYSLDFRYWSPVWGDYVRDIPPYFPH